MAASPETVADETTALRARVRELEHRLEECEDTLEAIRNGAVDALVVSNEAGEHQVYTLESADRPYRMLIEQIQEGAVTIGEDGTVLYCNRRVADMLGVPQERILGRSLAQFLLASHVAEFNKLLHDATHAAARAELSFLTEAGEELPAYVSLSLLQENDTTLICGILTDLTEQKVHLHELANANNQLVDEMTERERVEEALRHSQKMDAIGQLTGGIAHDFNNMLQGVAGSITLAQRRLALGRSQDASEYLDMALAAAERAATLTRRLLAFGRRQPLNPKTVVLDDLMKGMVGLIQRAVGPEITVEFRLQENCWPVHCDAGQLENALLNLAINARDAMQASGGRLTIQTAHVKLDKRDTGGWDDAAPGEYVRITVTDTGVGMPPEVLAHAFEPFFTTKPDGQGTGLGLSQLHGFMLQSRGVVRLESMEGVGTSVHLYLPRSKAHAGAADAIPAVPLESQSAAAPEMGSVLLVEDEELIRTLASDTLRDLGYRVLEAHDGPSGLKVLQHSLQDPGGGAVRVLVTDVGLPGGVNGRQLADAAREIVPDLPILLITGYAGDAITGQGRLGAGMEMLAKPFELEVLARRVQAMMGKPGAS